MNRSKNGNSEPFGARNTHILIPELMRNRLTRRQCVAYVGAGFSMTCGMPNWHSLLISLVKAARKGEGGVRAKEKRIAIDACEQAIENGEYAMAASMLRKVLSPTDIDETIRQQFGNKVLEHAPKDNQKRMEFRMHNLVRGPWAGILTTNYDMLIEKAIGESGLEVVMTNGNDPRLGIVLVPPPHSLFFVKMHGSISGSRLVLSTEEYDRTYLSTPRMTSFLTAIMLRYHIVFIGCSLEDEVVRIRRKLALDFEGLIPQAYALLIDSKYNRSRRGWLADAGRIECIFYPESDSDHKSVDSVLEEIAHYTDIVNRGYTAYEVTCGELAKLDVCTKLGKIGTANLELLKFIRSLPNHEIEHVELVELVRHKGRHVNPTLFDMNPEERVYRVLFLISIGMICESLAGSSSIRYRISKDTEEALETL